MFTRAVCIVLSCTLSLSAQAFSFNFVSDEQALKVGQQTAQSAIKEIGLYEEPRLLEYLNNILARLNVVADTPQSTLQLLVLDSDEINAWATPGYMNVYRGILPYFNSEAELVAVMGHEYGHIAARHIGQSLSRQTVASLIVTGLALYAGTRFESDTAANLLTTVGAFGAGVALQSYSRDAEFEADRLGLQAMARMGYDPREAWYVMDRLDATSAYAKQLYFAFEGKYPGKPPFYSVLASHPEGSARKAEIEKLVGRPDGTWRTQGYSATPQDDPTGQARYYRVINGLPVGPKPQQGIAGRNYIAFPKQQFVWRFPQGFATRIAGVQSNGKTLTSWQIVHPQTGTRGMILFRTQAAGLNPCSTLAQSVGGQLGRLNPLPVGNLTGCTATGAGARSGFYARYVAIPVAATKRMAIIQYQFPVNDAATEAAVMSATQSSEVLTEARAKSLKPLQLATRVAGAGDTVARLSAALPQGALTGLWFRALNGLGPEDELRPGMRYKTVIDPNRL